MELDLGNDHGRVAYYDSRLQGIGLAVCRSSTASTVSNPIPITTEAVRRVQNGQRSF